MRHVKGLSIAALITAMFAAVAPVQGQRPQHAARAQREIARRVPVTVVIVDEPEHRGAGTIMRQAGPAPRDLIVLSSAQATGERLAAAVVSLLVIRERDGDLAGADGVFRVQESALPKRLLRREVLVADAVLANLRASAPQSVEGVGTARARVVYLPSTAMLNEMRAAGRWRLRTSR